MVLAMMCGKGRKRGPRGYNCSNAASLYLAMTKKVQVEVVTANVLVIEMCGGVLLDVVPAFFWLRKL